MPHTGFRSAGHPKTLLAGLLHFDISFMVWVLLGALGAYVAADFGLSPLQKGLMVAVPPLGGSVFRLILGPIADRYGMKRTAQISMALTFVPLLWAWLAAGTYGEVLGIGLLLGVSGASFAVILPLVSRWYPPEHQGLALGIAGAGNSGTIIAALAAPRLAEQVGWHGVFGLALLPVAATWIAFSVLAKEPVRPESKDSINPFSLMRETDARVLCGFYMLSFGGYVGLSGFLPIFFVDRFGLTKVAAGGFAALCAAAGSFLRPLGGGLADKVGGTTVLAGTLAVAGACAIGLVTVPALSVTVVLLFVLMGALGIANGAVFQLVPQRFPARVGTMTGLVGAAGGLGGFAIPFALGSLAGVTGSFASGFALYAAALVVGVGGVLNRQRTWRLEWRQLEVAV